MNSYVAYYIIYDWKKSRSLTNYYYYLNFEKKIILLG